MIGCFLVGLLIAVLVVVVAIALIFVVGIPLYRLEMGSWPWKDYDSIAFLFVDGVLTILVSVMFTIIAYPLIKCIASLGCWALKAGR